MNLLFGTQRRFRRLFTNKRQAEGTGWGSVPGRPWRVQFQQDLPVYTGACLHAHSVTSVVSDSVRPHRQQPTRLLCPWDSPGKNTGGGCHFLLQGNLPNPGIESESPASLALAGRFFTTEQPGNPLHWRKWSYFFFSFFHDLASILGKVVIWSAGPTAE